MRGSLARLRAGAHKSIPEVAPGQAPPPDNTSLLPRHFEALENGPLRLWAYPNPQHRYVLGVDVAEGLEHGDYSVAQVLDAHTGDQVAKWRGHIAPREFGVEVYRLGLWYHTALIGVESNNHGISTIDRLVELNYPRLFRRRTLNEITQQWSIKWGWATNSQSKPLMVDSLDQAIRDRAITIHCRQTLAELRSYIRDEKGKLHGSPHDDDVMALAIAVQMLEYVHEDGDDFGDKDDYWSVEWWRRQIVDLNKPANVPIGYYQQR